MIRRFEAIRTPAFALALALSLMAAVGGDGSFAAQTPSVADNDPCGGVDADARLQPGEDGGEIGNGDAVAGALTVRQQNVVIILDVIIAYSDDESLVEFATTTQPAAKVIAADLDALSPPGVRRRPADLVGVLDVIRSERGLDGDAGSLDPFIPGFQLDLLCRGGIDLEAVAIASLRANDTAIIDLAELAYAVVDDPDRLAAVDRAKDASADRLVQLDGLSQAATPAP